MEQFEPTLLLVLSIGVFGGMLGGWFFQRIRVPQVVGYIVIGLIIGESGLKLVSPAQMQRLTSFNFFALGIIGFLVGGELKMHTFRKYGKQFAAILLGEGLLAFMLVSIASTAVIYWIHPVFPTALAGGVVLGAIASATDPASTIDVLWEYRSKGALTTAIIAIVALDDALAMTLYGLGTGASQMLADTQVNWSKQVMDVGVELIGALFLGALGAFVLIALLRLMDKTDKAVALAVGLIMLLISGAIYLHMDLILAAMTMGLVVTNLAPERSKRLFELLRSFSIPIYVLFFVLVGARLGIGNMPVWLWVIVALYVVGRSSGKVIGAWFGAKVSKSETKLCRYIGPALFAQGGVAIGLSIMAGQSLQGIQLSPTLTLGDAVVFVVTATTLVVQIIGPPMVKFAITWGGETGRDVTEDDILERFKVSDVMTADAALLLESTTIRQTIDACQRHNQFVYPVLNQSHQVVGTITLDALKDVITEHEQWDWQIAADFMLPLRDWVVSTAELKAASHLMQRLNLDQIPVIDPDNKQLVGILDRRLLRTRVNHELLVAQGAGEGQSHDASLKPVPIPAV